MKAKQSLELEGLDVERYARQYLDEKLAADAAKTRVERMAKNLKAYLESHGIEDEKGHRWVDAGEVGQLKRERAVSTSVDEEAARSWLKEIGKTKQVIKKVWVEEFDEDEFFGLCHDMGLTSEEVDAMMITNETFRLKVV